jgi:hypothetical protein
MGQVIHDLPAGVYRWRQIMPVALSLNVVGPESPETEAARQLVAGRQVRLTRDERTASGLRVLAGQVPERPVEVVLDADGRILRGKCSCSHHHQYGLRRGPCRHLQALRNAVREERTTGTLETWFERLWN